MLTLYETIIVSPSGDRLHLATPSPSLSPLAQRIADAWRDGQLTLLAWVLLLEDVATETNTHGHCHRAACILEEAGVGRWVTDDTPDRGVHSWIERDGEIADVLHMVGHAPLLHVRPTPQIDTMWHDSRRFVPDKSTRS